jgi:hypothetical protein
MCPGLQRGKGKFIVPLHIQLLSDGINQVQISVLMNTKYACVKDGRKNITS